MINLHQQINPENKPLQTLLGDYSHEKGEYTQIDIEYLKTHEKQRDTNLRDLYSPEIEKIILDLQAAGKFPYNETVKNEVKRIYGLEGEGIGWVVYCTQGYLHLKTALENAVKMEKELTENGFTPLKNMEENVGKKFYVVGNTTNFLGISGTKKTEKPQLLIKDADNRFFFIARANSRKGIYARENQYVKAA